MRILQELRSVRRIPKKEEPSAGVGSDALVSSSICKEQCRRNAACQAWHAHQHVSKEQLFTATSQYHCCFHCHPSTTHHHCCIALMASNQPSPLIFSLAPAINVAVSMADRQLLGTHHNCCMHCSPATSHGHGCFRCTQPAPWLTPLPPSSWLSPLLHALASCLSSWHPASTVAVFIATNQLPITIDCVITLLASN